MTITATILSRLVVCTLVSATTTWSEMPKIVHYETSGSYWSFLVIFTRREKKLNDVCVLCSVQCIYCKTRKIIFFQIKIKVITFFSVLTRLSSSIIMKKIWYRGLILSKSSEMTCLPVHMGQFIVIGYPYIAIIALEILYLRPPLINS